MKKYKCCRCGIEYNSKSSIFNILNPETCCYNDYCKFHALEFLESQGFEFKDKDGVKVTSKKMTLRELKYHCQHLDLFLNQKMLNKLNNMSPSDRKQLLEF